MSIGYDIILASVLMFAAVWFFRWEYYANLAKHFFIALFLEIIALCLAIGSISLIVHLVKVTL